jgi:single-stranded-DNA-specific exonuclease
VLVTDHHLPAQANGETVLPTDCVIVNPNQPGCAFESKAIAGVGVMFYVLLALRAEMRNRGVFDAKSQPKVDSLLPLVALGTVADVVRLDANNRRLVAQGLKRVRTGALPPGLAALFTVASRKPQAATAFDFGFAVGPRLNAAGRLSDMTLGIEALSTDDTERAHELARMLDGINRERKTIEGDMREQALQLADEMLDESEEPPPRTVRIRPRLSRGRGGHRCVAPEGQVAPPHLRVCDKPGRRQRKRVERLGTQHSGFSFARCARPRGQTLPRCAAALRWPCDGGRLHHRR